MSTNTTENITEETEQSDELDFKRAYLSLFNEVSRLIDSMRRAQVICESMCIGDDVKRGDIMLDDNDDN